MATKTPNDGFGRVSRIRGMAFKGLTFVASTIGILALGILLVYVSIDAFDLANVAPEWLLTYFLTLVAPYMAFCLYSVNDREFTEQILRILVGALVVIAVVFTGIELLWRSIPRLNWQLAYVFLVGLPMSVYLTVAATRGRAGSIGLGFLGRLVGGAGIGLWLFAIFVVVSPQLWFIVYTVGIFPALTLFVYSKVRDANIAALLWAPAAVVGIPLAYIVNGFFVVYPSEVLIYAWTLVLPFAGLSGVLVAREWNLRTGGVVGATVLVLSVGGGLGLGLVALSPESALLAILGITVPTVPFLYRIMHNRSGAEGLLLPVLLVGGSLVGALAVDTFGIQSPNPWIDLSFITGTPTLSNTLTREAGIYPALIGSIIIITLVAVLTFVLGVGTALFLEEYTRDDGWIGSLTRLIQVNIANLAAVPSVVYGLLGLGLFVQVLNFGVGTAISASLTLSLLILPITVISSQEAIRSVPDDLRDGSYAMGATKWQTTKNVVLPEAMPGILTGIILSLGRAIGETAPLIMIGVASISFSPPIDIWSTFSAMPMLIYQWSGAPAEEFRYGVTAAAVLTLLIVLLAMNATAIIIRNRYEREH